MLRRICLAIAFVGLTAECLCAQNLAKPAKPLDLSLIPDNAVVAVVIHPKQVLDSPQAVLWPTEIFSAAGKKEMGFDPTTIEEVVGIAGLPQQGGGAPPFGLIVRSQQPIDPAVVGEKIVKQGTDEQVEGRRARLSTSAQEPSLVFVDDKTMIVANRDSLSWMLAAKPGSGTLHTLLKSVNQSPAAAVYLAVEPTRPILAGALPMFRQAVPPQYADLLDLPMTVNTVELTANFSGEVAGATMQLKLGTADPQTATDVAAVLKRALRDLRADLTERMAQEMNRGNEDDRELREATLKYFQRLGDVALAAVDPKPVGKEVIIKSDLRAGMAEVGVMTALLLPAVQSAREAARRVQSQNNLKQIALSFHNYHDTRKTFPANANYDANGKPLLSWRVHMLPYLEEGALYQEFHLDEPWDSKHNKKLIERMPAIYKHPNFDQPGKTVYQAIVGKNAAFEGNVGRRMREFTDGTSKTAMVAEVTPQKAVDWTKPEDWEFDADKEIDMNDFGGLSAGNIFNVVFADGHVEAFSRSMDPAVLKLYFTRNGGEPIPQ